MAKYLEYTCTGHISGMTGTNDAEKAAAEVRARADVPEGVVFSI